MEWKAMCSSGVVFVTLVRILFNKEQLDKKDQEIFAPAQVAAWRYCNIFKPCSHGSSSAAEGYWSTSILHVCGHWLAPSRIKLNFF